VVARFVEAVRKDPNGETMLKQAKESLWQVYPEADTLKDSLVNFVKQGADGPGLAFAGMALIPFHDPATVRPILERAMDKHTSEATRAYFLNAAPYVLSMGDVMYMQEGKIDKESREMADGLLKLSDQASQSGLGHAHALQLQELFNLPAAKQKDSDYGLAVWHESAYLLGTLELKDQALLAKPLTSGYSTVFLNVINALGFAANRDFIADLRVKHQNEVTPAMEQATAKRAIAWWQDYLKTHPDGNSNDAVMQGFHEAGYSIEADWRSPESQRALKRALDDANPILRYNAYRLLNQTYGTHFDLDIVFFAGKYALSFLDPSEDAKDNEKRLKQYWQERLKAAPAPPSGL
jgi:hypothetical protein